MTFLRTAPALLCMAFLGAAFSPTAQADEHDHMTTVTFSAPVEIPPVHITGMRILPAGTYVFKLLNNSANRHIVQIFNKNQTKIYATIEAIANYRLVPKDKTVITFNEGIAGKPEAIRAWFYPGAHFGEEFVYPKAKAIELAKATNQPVPATANESQEEVAEPEQPQVVAQLQEQPVVAVQPTGEVVELAQVYPPASPAEATAAAPAPEPAPATLPATSSSLPLIALCGFLALGGALSVRSLRKRVQ